MPIPMQTAGSKRACDGSETVEPMDGEAEPMANWDPEDIAGVRGLAAIILFTVALSAVLLAIANFTPWMFR